MENGNKLFTNLKIPLLTNEQIKKEYEVHTIAFLALIIRHVRGWFFSFHGKTYQNSNIEWSINLGLATAHNENPILKELFHGIALASVNLAGDSSAHLTEGLTKRYYQISKQALKDKKNEQLIIHPDMVNVYPEIGAQVVGFVESESWNAIERPFITMIDIGAGTVDVSFFSVQRERGKRTFNFFQNSVEQNGVLNLHLHRIKWLKAEIKNRTYLSPNVTEFLDDISSMDSFQNIIPEHVNEYLINFEVKGNENIDVQVFNKCIKQVFGVLIETKRNRVPMNDSNWKDLPIFLCGGGSRMKFYQKIIDKIIGLRGYSWLQVRREELTKPNNLIAEGLKPDEYDRLSVAYGLSFEQLGKIIPSGSIEDFNYQPTIRNYIDVTDDR